MPEPIVEIKNLTKVFGDVVAVDNVSFDIGEKEFLILLGPSGCGKTTILRMVAGLEIPTSGEIYLKGRCIFSSKKGILIPARERGVGLVFQSYALWPHMTVFENIAFGLKVKRMKPELIRKKVEKILKYMRLEKMASRYPQQMSGGQQQRVALARMLVSEPNIFLMDEPLSNLDAKLRLEMRAEIKNIHFQTGATTIYVTHDQIEGQTMAKRIAIINNGIIEQIDSPKTVYSRPSNLFVADFIGSPSINKIEGTIAVRDTAEGSMAEVRGEPPLSLITSYKNTQPGLDVVAAIRPENISIVSKPGINTIEAEVQTILPSGPETILQVKYSGVLFSILVTKELEVEVGHNIFVSFPPKHILMFDKNSGNLLPL
jgi:multiple sugar transport system ATP-binding protein